MDQAQAQAEARRRNLELGAAGPTDAYWIEVQQPDGTWGLEKHVHKDRKGLGEHVIDGILGGLLGP